MREFTVLFWLTDNGPYDVGYADVIERVQANGSFEAFQNAAQRREVRSGAAYAIPDTARNGTACVWLKGVFKIARESL